MAMVTVLTAMFLTYPLCSYAARKDLTMVRRADTESLGIRPTSKFPIPSNHQQLKAVGTYSLENNYPGVAAPGLVLPVGSSYWTSTNGPAGGNVYTLAADNSNGYIYAGTDSGVFRSTDNGGSWTHVAYGASVQAIAVGSNGYIYAGTYNGIYLSTDMGGSWITTTMTDQTMSLSVAPSGVVLAGTNSNGIFASTDNGTNWTQIATSTGEEVYSVAINSSGYIFAGTYDDVATPNLGGVYRSTDGGKDWVQVGLANTWVWTLAINSSGDIFAGTYGYGVYLSTDGGNTWTQENSGLTNTLIYSLAVNSSGDIFAGSDGNGVYETTDNGSSWTATGPTDRTFWALAVSPSGYVFAGADSGGVYRTTNPTISGIPPLAPMLANPANGSTGTTTNPTLYWNTSSGASGYGLQISTDSTFATMVTDTAGLSSPTDSLSGLSTLTTYFWRVNASDSAGTSEWSSVWHFTTGGSLPVPPAPILSSPVDSATGVAVNPTLIWNASLGARSYRLQVSTEVSFTQLANIVYDTSGISRESATLKGLSAYSQYYWRVDATDSSGTSAWSSVWHFTTAAGTHLLPPTLALPSNGATGAVTDPILSWNGVSGAVYYELQVSSDTTFTTVLFERRNLTATSQEVAGLSEATTYYWRVKASDSSDSSAWSQTWSFETFTYPSSISVTKSFVFPGTLDSTSYQIIGLPGEIDTLIGSLVSGTQGTDWNAYWDNGDTQNYYIKYDGSPTFDFKPGRAFWILSKNPFQISRNAPAVPLDTNDSYPITLHIGWNLISDPFDKSVTWSSIQSVNGTSQPIWAFSNGSYSKPTAITPYQGYYFYNDLGLSHLRIPYLYSATIASTASPASVTDGNITATLKEGSNDLSSITVGLKEVPGIDTSDIFAPPSNFERARIFVVDSTVHSAWKELVQDFRDTIGTGQEFNLCVFNKTAKNLNLKFNIGNGLSQHEIYLIDKDINRSYNLKYTSDVLIPSYNKLKNYSILIGDESFVNQKLAELVPQEFLLFQNYPNPFNPVTIIRFEIPASEHMTLTVYDILGRRVETLMNTNVSAGYYEIPFDGNRFASGVYFYRISAGSFSQVKKMLLLK